MENKFKLKFNDNTITRLAGYTYGKKIFDEQVKGKIEYDKLIIIEFPLQIERVASSFVQGFFEEIIENIGNLNFDKKVKIKASNKVKDAIKEGF